MFKPTDLFQQFVIRWTATDWNYSNYRSDVYNLNWVGYTSTCTAIIPQSCLLLPTRPQYVNKLHGLCKHAELYMYGLPVNQIYKMVINNF